MAKVAKLINNVRTTELDALSDAMEREYAAACGDGATAVAGVLALFVSLAFMAFVIVRRIAFGDPVQGWASLVCLVTFFSGVQLSSLGICGLYISKIYTEVKKRPLYIVKEEK